MALKAERKWDVLRVLHEKWAAPLVLLAELSGKELPAFKERVEAQNWQVKNSAISLQRRLSEIVDTQMSKLTAAENVTHDPETSARAIAAIAKIMESVANVALKLEAMEERTISYIKSEIDDAKKANELDDTFALDGRLEALVAGLEKKGNSASGNGGMAK